MHRKLKITLFSSVCLVPVVTILMLSIPWKKITHINCQGSSALVPFVKNLTNEYEKNRNIDLIVEAGGSGLGIQQIANGLTDIGHASKNPSAIVEDQGYKEQWGKQKIKTVTIGWESICLVYYPLHDEQLDITNSNIDQLYALFSGYLGNYKKKDLSLYHFLDQDSRKKIDQNEYNDTYITPFVRAGGSICSGTADAFVNNFGFDHELENNHNLTTQQKKALTKGEYGNEIGTIEDTDDANSRAWAIFNSKHKKGSMIYLSSGFTKINYDLIIKSGYQFVKCNGQIFTSDAYQWQRPLNCMFSLNNKHKDEIFAYFNWLFFGLKSNEKNSNNIEPSKYYKRKMKEMGCKPLSINQIKSMTKENQLSQIFWQYSDIDLGSYGANPKLK